MQLTNIQTRIFEIRGQKIMLDFDLAELYEVETRILKQAVKRNLDRFPDDFMFLLTEEEVDQMVSQNVIPSKSNFGGALPFAFSEQGVSMLSSILRSKKALEVNIAIMRTFVFIRQNMLSNIDLTEQLKQFEYKYDTQFKDVYEVLNYLLQKDKGNTEQKARKKIGFKGG